MRAYLPVEDGSELVCWPLRPSWPRLVWPLRLEEESRPERAWRLLPDWRRYPLAELPLAEDGEPCEEEPVLPALWRSRPAWSRPPTEPVLPELCEEEDAWRLLELSDPSREDER